jgi:hypothetical protein
MPSDHVGMPPIGNGLINNNINGTNQGNTSNPSGMMNPTGFPM